MTFSGDQNGGLARYLPGCTAGWREEAQKWGVKDSALSSTRRSAPNERRRTAERSGARPTKGGERALSRV